MAAQAAELERLRREAAERIAQDAEQALSQGNDEGSPMALAQLQNEAVQRPAEPPPENVPLLPDTDTPAEKVKERLRIVEDDKGFVAACLISHVKKEGLKVKVEIRTYLYPRFPIFILYVEKRNFSEKNVGPLQHGALNVPLNNDSYFF